MRDQPDPTRDDEADPSLTETLLRLDLEAANRSDSTIDLYLTVAQRIERFAKETDQTTTVEGWTSAEARAAAQSWLDSIAPSITPATLKAYRSAATAYVRVLDDAFEADELWVPDPEVDATTILINAGRRAPSTPLTNQQLAEIRAKHQGRHEPNWIRTAIELGLSGLAWSEIMEASGRSYSLYLEPRRITLKDRTIEIHDRATVEWLDYCRRTDYPGPKENGANVSLRTVKRAIRKAVTDVRGQEFGTHQGLRALHNTGARRQIMSGQPANKVAATYRRQNIQPSWKREAA